MFLESKSIEWNEARNVEDMLEQVKVARMNTEGVRWSTVKTPIEKKTCMEGDVEN